jgi:hypothetical protein
MDTSLSLQMFVQYLDKVWTHERERGSPLPPLHGGGGQFLGLERRRVEGTGSHVWGQQGRCGGWG